MVNNSTARQGGLTGVLMSTEECVNNFGLQSCQQHSYSQWGSHAPLHWLSCSVEALPSAMSTAAAAAGAGRAAWLLSTAGTGCFLHAAYAGTRAMSCLGRSMLLGDCACAKHYKCVSANVAECTHTTWGLVQPPRCTCRTVVLSSWC